LRSTRRDRIASQPRTVGRIMETGARVSPLDRDEV
jgi:hypothetical protein